MESSQNVPQNHRPQVTDLFGVYDADGTLVGEAAYWIGARFGLRHCSLCDITHSLFTVKSEWQDCVSKLLTDFGITFTAFHRNDQPDEVRALIAGNYPAVVSRDSEGTFEMFLPATEINQCSKSTEEFMQLIIKKL